MPVLAKNSYGKLMPITLTNVRYVPGFDYTLLSVDQMWKEHKIKPEFGDDRYLQMADGKNRIPFDPRIRLPAVTLCSIPILEAGRTTPGAPFAIGGMLHWCVGTYEW